MNLVGKLLGNRYEIIEKIGNGGMATVYKARCLVLKRYVAVKVLREEYTTDNEFIKRFNIEAESAASLTHPNIVSVYDVGQEGNLHYIVMELIKGKTLKEIIVEQGKLGWKWSLKVAMQIASALETAHRNNIIHRDIKPHNIIITEDGTAKVTDFGIAKAVSNSTITAFGTTLGSVHYFSPEHARGGYTDAKSDLYSLGVVLYEMVTGRVPFDADTPVSVALKHMQEKPVEPITLNPSLPQSVNDIIMKAMQKDPNMRYESATEMIADLEFALKNPGKAIDMEEDRKYETQRVKVENNTNSKHKENGKKKGKFAKFKEYLNNHKVVKWLLIIVALIIIFLASIFITIWGSNKLDPKPAEVTLPDLKGLTVEEAQAKYPNIVIKVKEEAFDPEIKEDKIISQTPPYQENYTVNEGSTIEVIVSKGQEIVDMIKFVGMKKDEVFKVAAEKGFIIKISEDYSDEVEAGVIIEQKLKDGENWRDVKEGEKVLAGSEIELKVSLGIEQVEVPDLSGLSEADAKAKITESKLKCKAVYTKTDSSKGTGVIEQSISAHSMVNKNEEITIWINDYQAIKTGTATINVAKLVGYTKQYTKVENGKDEDGNTIYKEELVPAKTVHLLVKVNDTQVESKTVTEDSEAVTVRFDGTDTVRIEVFIDNNKKATRDLNLNNQTDITIE